MDSQDSVQRDVGVLSNTTSDLSKNSSGRIAGLGERVDSKAVTKSNSDQDQKKNQAAENGSVAVVGINRQTVFSLRQARDVVAVIYSITRSYSRRVDVLIDRLDAMAGSNEPTVVAIEAQVDALIQEWQGKVRKLGALPQGLWIADIDSGDGYYCWKFPEPTVQFWHGYSDGFSKRRPVDPKAAFVPIKKPAETGFTLSPAAPKRMLSVACPPALQHMEIPE